MGVLTSAYYQSSPIKSVGAFNNNDYMWHVLRLGTINLIIKCRKHFWKKVVFNKSTKIKTLVLYWAIRPIVSNGETHHVLN